MSVIAEFTVPAAGFSLGATLGSHPDLHIRLDEIIPVGSMVVPYLWISTGEVEGVVESLRNEPEIESIDSVDSLGDRTLLKVTWAEGFDGLIESIVETDAALLEAEGSDGVWNLQLRFADHASMTAFYRLCHDREVPIELLRVHDPGFPDVPNVDFVLTETQREALSLALENGYFSVPRRTNLVELGERLGISDTAVSQRLRRGIESLVLATIRTTSVEE